jgi:hypothetical protein
VGTCGDLGNSNSRTFHIHQIEYTREFNGIGTDEGRESAIDRHLKSGPYTSYGRTSSNLFNLLYPAPPVPTLYCGDAHYQKKSGLLTNDSKHFALNCGEKCGGYAPSHRNNKKQKTYPKESPIESRGRPLDSLGFFLIDIESPLIYNLLLT